MAQESQSNILHEGIIFKKGQINKSWKSRWFVLYDNRRLAYFENESSKSDDPIKEINLSEVHSINIIPHTANTDTEPTLQRIESISVASVKCDRPYSFELLTAKRTYLLSCWNLKELNKWIDNFEKSIFGGRLYNGWLIKRGAYRKSWKKRWFVIYDTQEMRYYDDESRKEAKGLIKLHEVLLMCPGDKDQYNQTYTIQLMTPDRNWVLATENEKERDEWFNRLEETIHGAKRLITSHEGYLWKTGQVNKAWKKRYFALSKGWLFYFEEQFHCNKFKSIAFFSEAFFNQAFRLYVKGSIPLHQTTIQRMNKEDKEEKEKDEDIEMEKEYVFKIVTHKREFQFAADNKNELEKWFKAFHSTHSSTMAMEMEYHDEYSDDTAQDEADEEEDQEEEQKENDQNRTRQATVMDILDPDHSGKWVDIEDESVEQQT
eukprot:305699_1